MKSLKSLWITLYWLDFFRLCPPYQCRTIRLKFKIIWYGGNQLIEIYNLILSFHFFIELLFKIVHMKSWSSKNIKYIKLIFFILDFLISMSYLKFSVLWFILINFMCILYIAFIYLYIIYIHLNLYTFLHSFLKRISNFSKHHIPENQYLSLILIYQSEAMGSK